MDDGLEKSFGGGPTRFSYIGSLTFKYLSFGDRRLLSIPLSFSSYLHNFTSFNHSSFDFYHTFVFLLLYLFAPLWPISVHISLISMIFSSACFLQTYRGSLSFFHKTFLFFCFSPAFLTYFSSTLLPPLFPCQLNHHHSFFSVSFLPSFSPRCFLFFFPFLL